jgi:hypothetical protein
MWKRVDPNAVYLVQASKVGYAASREQAMADFKAAWERKP